MPDMTKANKILRGKLLPVQKKKQKKTAEHIQKLASIANYFIKTAKIFHTSLGKPNIYTIEEEKNSLGIKDTMIKNKKK